MEIEFGSQASSRSFSMPSGIKFTPDVERGLFHRLEFAVDFDSLSSEKKNGSRPTQFGDSLTFKFRRPIHPGEHLSLAVAPQVEVLLRDATGTRLGAVVIGVYAFGLNSVVGNFIWTVATSPSAGNPRHQVEWVAGYARTFGHGPIARRFNFFAEYEQKSPQRAPDQVSVLGGVHYWLRPHLVLDVAVQGNNLRQGPSSVAFVAGLTANLGRIWPR
jgi:hypothetical protein